MRAKNTETPRDRRSDSIGLAFPQRGPAGECQGFAGQDGFVTDATVPTRALKPGWRTSNAATIAANVGRSVALRAAHAVNTSAARSGNALHTTGGMIGVNSPLATAMVASNGCQSGYGSCPVHISSTVTPNAHASDANENRRSITTSGLSHFIGNTFVCAMYWPCVPLTCRDSPKSDTFTICWPCPPSSLNSMFRHATSR